MKENNRSNNILRFLFLLLLILLTIVSANAQFTSTTERTIKGTVYKSLRIKSRLLGEDLKYSVYLPPEYPDGNKRFPVLYLLHGFDGDETSWIKMGHIQKSADSMILHRIIRPIIIVMPAGQNSYFINDYKNQFPYEDFFIKEFIPYIDSVYRTLSEKKFRGIAGLSMGGYGAIILPLKHPDTFGYSIALSAAIRTDATFEQLSPEKYKINFSHLYGTSPKSSGRITNHWKENSPFYLVNEQTAYEYDNIKWYIDCGIQDFLLPGNEAFHQLLLKLEIPHEYHMRIGTHNWNYWNMEIPYGLKFFSSHLPMPEKH